MTPRPAGDIEHEGPWLDEALMPGKPGARAPLVGMI
jgi:hypothetical protein